MPAAPLVGQEAQVSVSRGRELPVGLRTGEGGGQSWGHSGENGGWSQSPTQRKELEPRDGPSVPPPVCRKEGRARPGAMPYERG